MATPNDKEQDRDGQHNKLWHGNRKSKIPVIQYEFTSNPNPVALAQGYEILFEEVLRIRKNKNGTEANSNLCESINLTSRR